MGRDIAIDTPVGSIGAWRADPEGAPLGALVVVQEIFGVNAHVRSVADGFAAKGYIAIAPAVFDPAERSNPGKVYPVHACREWHAVKSARP